MQQVLAGRENGEITLYDTIEYQGLLWLVPVWLDNLETGLTQPGLAIGGPGFRFDPGPEGKLVLTSPAPLPESLLHGVVPPGLGMLYRTLEKPEIWVPFQNDDE